MRGILLTFAAASLLAGSASGADDKPTFTGSWQLAVDKSDLKSLKPTAMSLVIDQPEVSEIAVVETLKTDAGEQKRTFKCSTVRKECDYTESGQPSKMSMYYYGTKLIAIERIGKDAEVINKRTYSLGNDGALTVEVVHMVPAMDDADKLVFTKHE